LSFGTAGSPNSLKHAAVAIIEDQKTTHKSTGMTIPFLEIGGA
jgi:hypothetical protein